MRHTPIYTLIKFGTACEMLYLCTGFPDVADAPLIKMW